MLAGMAIETVEVRTPVELESCDGLILPGGESTTQLQFLQEEGLYEAIKQFAAEDKAIFGTCAGAILLASEVLAEYAGRPALVQKAHILAAAFHPELTDDTTVHQRFLELAAVNSHRS